MAWLKTSIEVSGDTISIGKGFSSKSMSWKDVSHIYGEKVDKVTYEELFLILDDSGGELLTAGEMDQGFADFEATLHAKLDRFPADWRAKLESAAAGVRDQLWSREDKIKGLAPPTG